MIDSQKVLYYATINDTLEKSHKFWDGQYLEMGPRAQLFLNIARYFGKNSYVSRSGEWPLPWNYQIVPRFRMPAYNPEFSMTFSEVTDRCALEIGEEIRSRNTKFAVYYSGGIDSVVSLVALLKNLSHEELRNISVCLSSESIIENPLFFEKYIVNKLNILDSGKVRYSDVQRLGHKAITSDQGDSIFGTELGTKMYYNFRLLTNEIAFDKRKAIAKLQDKVSSTEAHYSQYVDLLVTYFKIPRDSKFGQSFYEAIVQNIKTSAVPIYTLHDFFWWMIFNFKYMECALRSTVYYHDGNDLNQSVNETVVNWFNHENYQLWSMANNNNGQKIRGFTAATYKWAARTYIYDFDKNDWYFRHKLKLSSLKPLIWRNEKFLDRPHIFGMTDKYELLNFNDGPVLEFIKTSLRDFK